MAEVFHRFTSPSGEIRYLTMKDAMAINEDWVFARINEIATNHRNKKMKKDGFTPGWQENIREYCGGRGEYNSRLKELGLVECGYDTGHIKETTTEGGYCESIDFALAAREAGVELTDNEVEAIGTGEFYKDVKLDLDPE